MRLKPAVFLALTPFVVSWLPRALAQDEERHSVADVEKTVELPEMLVVATRTKKHWLDTPGSVLVLTDDDMQKNGVQDIGGLAKYDPTVSLPYDFASGDGAYAYGQSGYGSINIRGVEGNRIAMELDGVRQAPQYVSTSFDMGSNGGAGGVGRDYFDPAMFEMVEVLKGGASALYGSDALGGVVSFTTPDPEHLLGGRDGGGLLRTQYFSVNDSVAIQAGGAVKKRDTSVLLLLAHREGQETQNHGEIAPNPAEFTSDSVLLKAEQLHGDHLFRLTFENFERDTYIDAQSAADSSFSLYNDFVHNDQLLERERSSIQWEYTPEGEWLEQATAHLYWQDSRSSSKSDSASKPLVIGGLPIPGSIITRRQTIDFQTEIVGFNSTVTKKFGAEDGISQLAMVGIDVSAEQGENAFSRVNTGEAADRISFSPSETDRAGMFVQDEITLQKKWIITPGMRVDWQSIKPDPNDAYLERLSTLGTSTYRLPESYDNLALSPRLSVAWKPSSSIQWYGTYAHGVRNPSAEQLSMIFDHPPDGANPVGTITVPNPNLREEKSDAFELGVKGEGDAGRFQTAAFYTRYADFIESGVLTGRVDDEGRDIVTTVNRGDSVIYGFEMGGTLEAGHWWSEAQGWSVGLNTGKSVGINRTDKTWLNSVEPWKTVASFGYDAPSGQYGGRFTGTYVDDVTRVDDSTNQGEFYRPPSWFTLDLGLYWRPQEDLTINVGLNNMLDEKYWTWGSVRRGDGHLGGNSITDRTTAPGRNFSISLTKKF